MIGDNEIAGLTDTTVPRRLGPKRASKIRKLFNLTKQDDVRQYVVRRKLPEKEGLDRIELSQTLSIIFRQETTYKGAENSTSRHTGCIAT